MVTRRNSNRRHSIGNRRQSHALNHEKWKWLWRHPLTPLLFCIPFSEMPDTTNDRLALNKWTHCSSHMHKESMRRYHLKLGDKSNAGGVVLEGEPSCTHHGTPFTYIGAKVYCHTCKTTGFIAAKGPRLSDRMMGKESALEGDICICECNSPPTMIASQHNSFQEVRSEEKPPAPPPEPVKAQPPAQKHTHRIHAWDSSTGKSLAHQPYIAEMDGGAQQFGHTDENGIVTIETDVPTSFRIHFVFDAPKRNLKPSQGP